MMGAADSYYWWIYFYAYGGRIPHAFHGSGLLECGCKRQSGNIRKKSVDKSVTFSDKHELRYQGNKIVERKIFEKTNTPIIYTYEYNGDLLKEEQLYKDGQFLSRRTFYYNAVGNLDSLVVSHNTYTHKSVEIFTDYDKKPNKIKGIMVLEELLPRALSRNNYLKKQS
ncbi:hypothetical protein KUH03_22330 [Sphingobacterium sp. E70]|uniref:hypothetical protein n=1 Tax=Sphingobacterium sp. E70 TaxID=2853439 RepID=UPI00211B87F1|nr:hypothetical protein [Sphingobacterium sp. E70]ULT22207.1 hypothetical protein KUH03_22330 [Sphingobacterium sp. E70]